MKKLMNPGISTMSIGLMFCFSTGYPAESKSQTKNASDSLDKFVKTYDHNNDGKWSRDEIPPRLLARMKRVDGNDDGELSRDELAKLPGRIRERILSMKDSGADPAKGKMKGHTKTNGEYYAPPAVEERVESKLKIGDEAPDFSLMRSGGDGKISLSQFADKKPVVLVFGSITCSPFRAKVTQTFDLYKKYRDKAQFLLIYIREAHPESTILIEEENGGKSLKKFLQTDSFETRSGNAQSCRALLDVPFPILVDGEANGTLAAYGAWPNRLVVVGKDGKIAWDSGKGPQGFRPERLNKWLSENL